MKKEKGEDKVREFKVSNNTNISQSFPSQAYICFLLNKTISDIRI